MAGVELMFEKKTKCERKALLGIGITTVIYLVIFIACIAIAFVLVLSVSGKLASFVDTTLKGVGYLLNLPVIGDVVRGIFNFFGQLAGG